MPDPAPFLASAERLADRFRSMPQSKLTQFAPPGLELARWLADRAQRLEGLPVRELPDAGIFAVGDQLALAAHELAAALAGTGGPGGVDGQDPGPGPGGGTRPGSGSGSGSGSGFGSGSGPGPEADPDAGAAGSPEAVLAEALTLVAGLAQRLATTRSARM